MAAAVGVAKWSAVAILFLLAVYGVAGLTGGLVPVNAGWRPPARGVTIWVETNGIHTGLVLPKVAAGIDWRARVPGRDLRDPRYAAHDHVAFGWGERTFYLDTPTWADARPGPILAAATGSDRTLVHVEHLPRPSPGGQVRAIVLRPDEYRALAAAIAGSFAADAAPLPGYRAYDAFYAATGRYDAVRTCNAWTGRMLARAGVRVGAWTPFPVTVMRWF